VHRRLVLEHVQRRAAQVPGLQRGHQRGLVDDRPAGSVHQERAALHPQQLGRADQVPRLRVERAMDGKHVGLLQELLERHAAAARGEEHAHPEPSARRATARPMRP